MQRGATSQTGIAVGPTDRGRDASVAVPRDQFRGSIGIRVSRQVGQKFELPGRPQPAEPVKPAPVEKAPEPAAPPAAKSALGKLFEGIQKWFARSNKE